MTKHVILLKDVKAYDVVIPAGTKVKVETEYETTLDLIHEETETLFWEFRHNVRE